ncbi:hypothetical protein [Massilia sp. DD77]|uniref:hypothetical protein n=1 Tax=Massilia sp. DD77 TaxID=3109349 RepID=UPI002FFFF285
MKLALPILSSVADRNGVDETIQGACPMNLRATHTPSPSPGNDPTPGRRHHQAGDLILSELNPHVVVDQLDGDTVPLNLLTFGNVREVCPKCRHTHLKLVLRQSSVRMAHLFCADCEACFDAHYDNGVSALTI